MMNIHALQWFLNDLSSDVKEAEVMKELHYHILKTAFNINIMIDHCWWWAKKYTYNI